MLDVTYNDADRILLDMADAAEAVEKYNQMTYGSNCGSPACMLGTYAWRNPGSAVYKLVNCHQSIRSGRAFDQDEWDIAYIELLEVLDITEKNEFDELFEVDGCGNAGCDGKKAAAYVREFVRKRALARVSAA